MIGRVKLHEAAAADALIPYKVDEARQIVRDSDGSRCSTTTCAIPTLLLRYFPTGMLGLGLTALLASFMSGMAGNVTAFNTVWTYDIYQAYLRPQASDAHYLWIGRMATVFGIAASVLTAYVAAQFNNIMDVLQLVFAFVNAPLLATFLLGHVLEARDRARRLLRPGRRHDGRRAAPRADAAGGRGRPVSKADGSAMLHTYPSEMAQNFWTAIDAFTVCFVVTVACQPDDEAASRRASWSAWCTR